jgi:hypothetical protein
MSERRADIIVKGLTPDEAEEFVYWFNAEDATEFSGWLADTLKEQGKEEKDIREEVHMSEELTYPPTQGLAKMLRLQKIYSFYISTDSFVR